MLKIASLDRQITPNTWRLFCYRVAVILDALDRSSTSLASPRRSCRKCLPRLTAGDERKQTPRSAGPNAIHWQPCGSYVRLIHPTWGICTESGQTLRGSFSAVSKPNFASIYSLESSWQDLQHSENNFISVIFWQHSGNFLAKCDFRAVHRSVSCRSRRELSNAYFLSTSKKLASIQPKTSPPKRQVPFPPRPP